MSRQTRQGKAPVSMILASWPWQSLCAASLRIRQCWTRNRRASQGAWPPSKTLVLVDGPLESLVLIGSHESKQIAHLLMGFAYISRLCGGERRDRIPGASQALISRLCGGEQVEMLRNLLIQRKIYSRTPETFLNPYF